MPFFKLKQESVGASKCVYLRDDACGRYGRSFLELVKSLKGED